MKIISTTIARKKIGKLIDHVRQSGQTIGLGRHEKIEALLIKYPDHLNRELDEWTNLISNAGSFDFLKNEPELYSARDLKK